MFRRISGSNAELYDETLMYTVAVMAALTYPSQCLPDELLEAKIRVKFPLIIEIFESFVFFQVANSLALKLFEPNFASFRDVWLGQFRTAKCGSNILKVDSYSLEKNSYFLYN